MQNARPLGALIDFRACSSVYSRTCQIVCMRFARFRNTNGKSSSCTPAKRQKLVV